MKVMRSTKKREKRNYRRGEEEAWAVGIIESAECVVSLQNRKKIIKGRGDHEGESQPAISFGESNGSGLGAKKWQLFV